MNTIVIRALEPSEWEILREFRLASLRDAPGVFATGYDAAAMWLPDDWRAETKGPDHQVFGLFDEKRLIGITATFTYRGDPTGQTALLAMSFILPPYRGRGLSRMFYEARLAWIWAQPQFRRVIVSHRKSNEASRRANQRHGFVQTSTASHTWPDGETEDEIFYELEISN
ncbi:MAG: GNAT family N-acetyltransferase [Pseudomonadota bacterium]